MQSSVHTRIAELVFSLAFSASSFTCCTADCKPLSSACSVKWCCAHSRRVPTHPVAHTWHTPAPPWHAAGQIAYACCCESSPLCLTRRAAPGAPLRRPRHPCVDSMCTRKIPVNTPPINMARTRAWPRMHGVQSGQLLPLQQRDL